MSASVGLRSSPLPALRLGLGPQHLIVLALLLAFPLVASPFWTMQIGAQSLFLGVIALSLMFLAGYGGMVSLSQMTVAGCAGYMIAVIGTNSANLGLAWPWWAAIPASILVAVVFALLIGLISVRTGGIYTIMITLAIGVAFFYFTRQNYVIFNGHSGFAGLAAPVVFGINWHDPLPFYYLSLAVALASYAAVLYLSRATFGLTLQAIRDNARRMNALGYNVTLHRVLAHGFAGVIAALGGILYVWLNGRVSPGTIDIGPVINILVIAVLGGLRTPLGPFIGAAIFVLLRNFAIDLISPERFNTLIGLIFLGIVLVSPDGVLGLWERFSKWTRSAGAVGGWRRN